jgi:hypothetical protein
MSSLLRVVVVVVVYTVVVVVAVVRSLPTSPNLSLPTHTAL